MNHIKNVTIIMRMYCVTFRVRAKYQEVEGKVEGKNEQVQNEVNGRKKIKLNEQE